VKVNKNNRIVLAVGLALLAAGGGWLAYSQREAPLVKRVVTLVVRDKPTVIGWPVAITSVAGDGSTGFADGAGRQAQFADPFGLAVDRAGNLYVADAGQNNRIRKIAPDGVVSTLAGGAREGLVDGSGAAAAFHTPSGIAIDAAGNLFVADTGNNAIRKVTPQGVVTTLAGGGAAGWRDGIGREAQFNGPVALALDKAGNVLVADTYNDRLRRVSPDGTVSTLAGQAPGYADGAAATALFDTPTGIAVDAQGTIFVADTGNEVIRKLGADGQVATFARAPEPLPGKQPLMRRPSALALTRDGYLYVGDLWRGRVLQIGPDGTFYGLTGIGIDIEVGDAAAVRLRRPTAIALGPEASLYVADSHARLVRRLAPRGVAKAGAQAAAVPVPAPSPASSVAPPPLPAAVASANRFPWPFAPQHEVHEVVGTIGEVRGSYGGESRDHFHNGLDVQGDMGVPVLAVADEKVASPVANWGFGELGEGMSVDGMTYLHMRVGRDTRNGLLDPARFALFTDEKGKPARVRVKRGTRFAVGDALGTVNRMYHVHLVYQRGGFEANPLLLPFSGFADTVAPRIEKIQLVNQADKPLTAKPRKRLVVARDGGPLSIVVDAYDQADGNEARRRLGLYKAGYQILGADGVPLPGFEKPLMNIEFNQLPPDPESVKVAYANNSGITVYGSARTRFLYVVTNTVRDGAARPGAWDPSTLAPGDYTIRIYAADYVGNEALAGRDLPITVQ